MVKAQVTEIRIPQINAGMYIGYLTGVEETSTKHGDALKWYCVVLNPAAKEDIDKEIKLSGISSTVFNTNSKAKRWYDAFNGKVSKAGESIDTDTIIRKKALLEVSIKEDEKNTFINIIDIKPMLKE